MVQFASKEASGAGLARHWYGLIVVSSVLVVTPQAAYFLRLPPVGFGENRVLAQAPTLPTNIAELHGFPQKVDDYIRDNFPLRARIISLTNYARYRAGYSTTKNIIVGQSGWLFWDNGTHLSYGLGRTRFDPAALDQWLVGLRQKTDYAKSRGMGFYVLPAPLQETIYPEKTPIWLARLAQSSSETDQIVSAAAEKGFDNIVDVRGPLIAAKATREVYRPYDTHWTGDGAYIAYRELMTRISHDFPDLAPLPQSSFTPAPTIMVPKGLSLMLGVADFVEHTGLVYSTVPGHPESSVIYLSKSRDWASPQVWETNGDASRTLLFIRDSFATELLPLLKPHFRRIVVVHHQDGFFREDLIDRYRPDITILEVIENGLRHAINPK